MFKKLKSLFIVEDGTTSTASSTSTEAKKADTATETSESLTTASVSTGGKPDAKFIDVLLKAIEANNLEGFDYLEYKQSLQSLANMDMDEATRYKSAFAMAKTMGASPAQLIQSASHYLAVLKKEESKFEEALKNQRGRQIVDRESDMKSLEAKIADKEKQIARLQKEIESHRAQLEERKKQINKAAAKVEATKERFVVAYNVVVRQIEADLENMKRYQS